MIEAIPFIIADVGSNWRISEDPDENKASAIDHINLAAEARCTAVKFQLFTHEELYNRAGDNTYALPSAWLKDLKNAADTMKIEFMCTAFSAEGVKAVDRYVNYHKVASSEMRHWGILEAIKRTRKPCLISTGGASHQEVGEMLQFMQGYPVSVMQCVASYPAKTEDYCLEFLNALQAHGICSGISDHTKEDIVALVAIGKGATSFEKHFHTNPYGVAFTPDTAHSVGPASMREYVRKLKAGYAASLGGKQIRPSEEEFARRYKRPAGYDTFRHG